MARSKQWRVKEEPGYLKEVTRTRQFRAVVPRVARALANVATYMMFDDHEVTDDWYLSESWRAKVLTAPFGRAVVRNAYAAYTVCQAWGNEPAAFKHEGDAVKSKNEELLETLVNFGAGPQPNAVDIDKLDQLLGLASPLQDPEVRFDYTVPGPRHLVRVLDTRSRRRYKGRLGPPTLLGESLDKQLPAGPLTDGRELLVVVSPVPVLMAHAIEALVQPLASTVKDFVANVKHKAEADNDGPPVSGPERFDVEGWGGDEESFNALIRRLATYQRCVILSGDVHFASDVALDFWNGQDATVDSRIVQLTSSPLRNSAAHNIRAAIFAARFSQQLLRGEHVERLGWKETAPVSVPDGTAITPARRGRMKLAPAIVPAGGWPEGSTIPADKPPDFRFRITGIRDGRLRSELSHPEHLQPPLPPFDAANPLQTYNKSPPVTPSWPSARPSCCACWCSAPTSGSFRFEPDGDSHTVIHELYSMDDPTATTGSAYTVHRSSLALSPSLDRASVRGGGRWLSRPRRRRRASGNGWPSWSRTSSNGSRRRSPIRRSPRSAQRPRPRSRRTRPRPRCPTEPDGPASTSSSPRAKGLPTSTRPRSPRWPLTSRRRSTRSWRSSKRPRPIRSTLACCCRRCSGCSRSTCSASATPGRTRSCDSSAWLPTTRSSSSSSTRRGSNNSYAARDRPPMVTPWCNGCR